MSARRYYQTPLESWNLSVKSLKTLTTKFLKIIEPKSIRSSVNSLKTLTIKVLKIIEL